MIDKSKKYQIIAAVLFSCVFMGIIDAIIQPGYLIKSSAKVCLFLLIPLFYSRKFSSSNLKEYLTGNINSIKFASLLGILVYFGILLGYLLLKEVFDFSAITSSLESGVGVSANNFLMVSLYISFINSFLEEFFFRGFGFIELKKQSNRFFAYHFSAMMFALYHIAMMIGWFDITLIALAIIALYIAGLLFNFFDELYGDIYPSWMIHICANLAINTIGCMLFGII